MVAINPELYQEYLDEIAEILDVEKAPARLDKFQLAKVADVKPETTDVWASTRRHNLPYIKPGRQRLYRIADVIRYLVSTQSVNSAT